MSHVDLHQAAMSVIEPAVRGDDETPDVDLKLRVGETRELSLASLGTAGFVWSSELEDSDDRILRLTRRRGSPEGAGPVGRSTTERLLITGDRSGTGAYPDAPGPSLGVRGSPAGVLCDQRRGLREPSEWPTAGERPGADRLKRRGQWARS